MEFGHRYFGNKFCYFTSELPFPTQLKLKLAIDEKQFFTLFSGYRWFLPQKSAIKRKHLIAIVSTDYSWVCMCWFMASSLFYQHEDWSADVRGSPSDLALLELSTPVQFNEYIQPACLPAFQHQEFHPEDNCWISGWGDTKGQNLEHFLNDKNWSHWLEF